MDSFYDKSLKGRLIGSRYRYSVFPEASAGAWASAHPPDLAAHLERGFCTEAGGEMGERERETRCSSGWLLGL